MAKRLKREPRDWRANGLAYAGHFAQGMLAGLALPVIWTPYLFTNYQRAEYQAYHNRNLEHAFTAGDMPSRDIADFLAGYWCGSLVTAAAIAVIALV